MNALVLADSTGYGKSRGRRTQSVIDKDGVFHIISPGSSLSAPGSKKNQRSLAHALAVETDPQLRQALAEDKDMKVVFINASESVRSKQQQKYEQMTRYRKALHLLETDFTIMSLQFYMFGFLIQTRSDFPNLYIGGDNIHFNKDVAERAYDSLVSKAIGEMRAKKSLSIFVVVVCAGWNAEANEITSMKESFCAKQLSLCETTLDLIRWRR